jgi:beta-glucosidase
MRHLQAKIDLGLFERPYVDEERALEMFENPQNRILAREIARQSMVLLKNDGSLPLKKTLTRIAVIGHANESRNQLGDYSYRLCGLFATGFVIRHLRILAIQKLCFNIFRAY